MDAVRNRDHLRIPVIGKFHCLQCPHGIPRKADSDNGILFVDPDHLLKHFRYTRRFNKNNVSPYHIQVKMQEIRKRFTAPYPYKINGLCFQDNVNSSVKSDCIHIHNRILNLLNIRGQNRLKDFCLSTVSILCPNLLYRIQLILYPFLKSLLKLRITLIA